MLTREVHEDLTTGPEDTIRDLKELQRIILNRRALHLDLTLSEPVLGEIRQELAGFLKSIPALPVEGESEPNALFSPVTASLVRRYHVSSKQRPLYVAIVNPNLAGGDVAFYADFPGYSELDHETLLRVLASALFGGGGPHSFFAKGWAAGLAYQNSIASGPDIKLIWYFANKSPDIPSLIRLVNSVASGTRELQDPRLVDYALSGTFSFSRSKSTSSVRGREMAHDLRDGNTPEKVRRFYEAILKLRREPDLMRALTDVSLTSICGVLVRDDCRKEQEAGESLFFFVGSEPVLSAAEKQLPTPGLLRVYPSDFWVK
jgi:hypothetical protein